MSRQSKLSAFFKPVPPSTSAGMKRRKAQKTKEQQQEEKAANVARMHLRDSSPQGLLTFAKPLPRYEQTVLDAGQRVIGLLTCTVCGMTFNIDHPADRKAHDSHHDHVAGLAMYLIGSATFEVSTYLHKTINITNPMEAILFVTQESDKQSVLLPRMKRIIETRAYPEIGFCEDVPVWAKDRKMLILICKHPNQKKTDMFICGFATVDPLDSCKIEPEGRIISNRPVAGIYSIWIHPMMRRKGLAKAIAKCVPYILYEKNLAASALTALYEPNVYGVGLAKTLAPQGLGHDGYLSYPYS